VRQIIPIALIGSGIAGYALTRRTLFFIPAAVGTGWLIGTAVVKPAYAMVPLPPKMTEDVHYSLRKYTDEADRPVIEIYCLCGAQLVRLVGNPGEAMSAFEARIPPIKETYVAPHWISMHWATKKIPEEYKFVFTCPICGAVITETFSPEVFPQVLALGRVLDHVKGAHPEAWRYAIDP
jgi:hypothetical protein